MIETIQCLPVAKGTDGAISTKKGSDILQFERYELEKLQSAICIQVYYSEFMENIRTLF